MASQSQLFGLSHLKVTQKMRIAVQATGDAVQASTTTSQEKALEWAKKDNRRLLHVVYRVGDLDKTIRFVLLIRQISSTILVNKC